MLRLIAFVTSALLFLVAQCSGFAPTTSTLRRPRPSWPAALASVDPGDVESARGVFYFWFFGGSGGGGIALSQFPQQFANFKRLYEISSDGPSGGGDTVGISPLCLYPRDLCKADLDKIFTNKLVRNVQKMVEQGPKPNYMSEKGYLCYPSFVAACAGCDPLTVRAVFDAMSTGDNVEPDLAQDKLDGFAADASPDRAAFKSAFLGTKLQGFSSIAFLLFLLGPIVGATCLDALAAGWFPEWPGSAGLPWSLLSPSALSIPQFWV